MEHLTAGDASVRFLRYLCHEHWLPAIGGRSPQFPLPAVPPCGPFAAWLAEYLPLQDGDDLCRQVGVGPEEFELALRLTEGNGPDILDRLWPAVCLPLPDGDGPPIVRLNESWTFYFADGTMGYAGVHLNVADANGASAGQILTAARCAQRRTLEGVFAAGLADAHARALAGGGVAVVARAAWEAMVKAAKPALEAMEGPLREAALATFRAACDAVQPPPERLPTVPGRGVLVRGGWTGPPAETP